LRIGDWVPCAIKSLAVDPFSSKVAVGRENGDIEVNIGTTATFFSW